MEDMIIAKPDELYEMVLTMMCCFYVLDMDYPSQFKLMLSLLQSLVLNDDTFFPVMKTKVDEVKKDFANFKAE